jgi:hypothetical protein
VAAGDRDVNDDVVAIDNEVPYLPMPVRKCGARRRELHRQGGCIHRGAVDLDGRCMKRRDSIKIALVTVLSVRQVQGSGFVGLGHQCALADLAWSSCLTFRHQHPRTRATNASNAVMKSHKNCSVDLSVTSPTSVIKPGVNSM